MTKVLTTARARGHHLWVFRHPAAGDTFLEFSEGPSPGEHRSRRAGDPDEAALELRLRALAVYAPDAWVLWEEVSLKE